MDMISRPNVAAKSVGLDSKWLWALKFVFLYDERKLCIEMRGRPHATARNISRKD